MRLPGVTLLFILCMAGQTQAQNWLSRKEVSAPVTRKLVLKLDLLSPVYDLFNPEMEFVLNKEASATAEIIWQSVVKDDYSFSKSGGRVHYRFYLGNQPAPSGIFVAAGLGAFKVEGVRNRISVFVPGAGYTYTSKRASANEVASFVWLGRQSVYKNRISLEYAIGTGYTFNPIDFSRENDWTEGRYAFYGNIRIGFLLGPATPAE